MGLIDSKPMTSVSPGNPVEDERPGSQKKQENQRREMAGRNDRLSQKERRGENERFQSEKTPCSRDLPGKSHYDSGCRMEKKRENERYPQHKAQNQNLSSLFDCFGDNTNDENESRHRMPNLDFYQNKVPFQPNGVHIDELLTTWQYADDGRLEKNHSYIQWLFPLREPGRNSRATPLTMDEIQMMKRDQEVMNRFFAAYRLMLRFYGIELRDRHTGEVKRAEDWKERFHNLNSHSHNNLRITRILKCLGEMGYDRYQAPLVQFFLKETLCENNLPNVKRSVLNYFMDTVKDKEEHRKLVTFTKEHNKSQRAMDKVTGSERRPTSRKH